MENKRSFPVIISVMSIFMLSMGLSAVVPALASIIGHFAPQGYSINTLLLVSTLPSLLTIPAALLAGALAGNKAKFKTLAFFGVLLFVVAGAVPAFANDFVVILIERAVFGIGLGIISPLGNALVLGLFEGQQRAKMLGLGTFIMNIGGILLQFLGGYLANYGWNYSFYAHALGLLSLILVILFLPEPKSVPIAANEEKPKIKIPGNVWLISILFGLAFMINYPTLLNMSSLIAQKNIGQSTAAGIILSLYTVGGMLSGLSFSILFKALKRYVVTAALFLIAASAAGILYSNNLILIAIFTTLSGFAFSLLIPTVFMIIGMTVKPMAVAMASSIFMAVMNLFAFLATYWIGAIGAIVGDVITKPIFIGMTLFIFAGIIFIFLNPFPKAAPADQKE